jgi:hypothetical protein
MYFSEYNVCDVTLHECVSTPGRLKRLPDHGGNRTRDLRDTIVQLFSLPRCPVWIYTQSNIRNVLDDIDSLLDLYRGVGRCLELQNG